MFSESSWSFFFFFSGRDEKVQGHFTCFGHVLIRHVLKCVWVCGGVLVDNKKATRADMRASAEILICFRILSYVLPMLLGKS